jgi:hypothetical protein
MFIGPPPIASGKTSTRDRRIGRHLPHYARNISKFHGKTGVLPIMRLTLAKDDERSPKGQ